MPFLSKGASAAVAGNGGGGGYLNPSKLKSGESYRFALLTNEPLEFYECWGETSDGSLRPFRFEQDPSPEEISLSMGDEYKRRLNRDGTAPEPGKLCIAIAAYDHEAKQVKIFSVSQKSIIRELDRVSMMEDFTDLTAIDFKLSREGAGLNTEYSLTPLPRKAGTDKEIRNAYTEAVDEGLDLSRLLTGGNPFKDA